MQVRSRQRLDDHLITTVLNEKSSHLVEQFSFAGYSERFANKLSMFLTKLTNF